MKMTIVGLTGSIGMGKSFIASCFAEHGAVIFDADAEVHKLLESGGEAYKKVAEIFPEAVEGVSINRQKLGDIVFEDKVKLSKLENILHPIVAEKRQQAITNALIEDQKLLVLDIPLLYEVAADEDCDFVVVAAAPAFIQTKRILQRAKKSGRKISIERAEKINSLQLSIAEKKNRADFVINTAFGKCFTKCQVGRIVKNI